MSVSQVKKRFGEMESYLGRDKEALRKLKLLKDDVNVLRTSLATAEETLELAEVVKDAARERADKAESEAESLTVEIHRLTQKLSSLIGDLKIATKPNSIDAEEEIGVSASGDRVECKHVLNRLQRALPQCPKLTSKTSTRHCPSFIRQEIAEGWSHQKIWTLGAAVALIAAHEGAVTIVDPVGVEFVKDHKKVLSGLSINMVAWFGKNWKEDPEHKRKRVYFGNKGPAELSEPDNRIREVTSDLLFRD